MNHDQNNVATLEAKVSKMETAIDGILGLQKDLQKLLQDVHSNFEILQSRQNDHENKMNALADILQGNGRRLGLLAEHRIMWRAHVWLLCSLSGLLGIILTVIVQHMIKM
ncbi:MAG: hypothetical protein KGL39_10240 [Patescibacteria group bacterium]|nr:hypothetical protein [Patescibacteria group bacterium]